MNTHTSAAIAAFKLIRGAVSQIAFGRIVCSLAATQYNNKKRPLYFYRPAVDANSGCFALTHTHTAPPLHFPGRKVSGEAAAGA